MKDERSKDKVLQIIKDCFDIPDRHLTEVEIYTDEIEIEPENNYRRFIPGDMHFSFILRKNNDS